MIFAAGLGTRLKPYTDTMPKALVPVCGRPLIEYVAERLKAAGIEEAVVNVHHFADMLQGWIEGQSILDMKISDEREKLLETGGGVLHAREHLDGCGSFLIHNVDILSNVDFRWFASCVKDDAVATLLVSERKTSRYLLFDRDTMRLVGWTNVTTGEVKSPYPDLDVDACVKMAFSGIHMMSDRIFDIMEDYARAKGLYEEDGQPRFPVMDLYLSICADHPVYGAKCEGLKLIDVGKLDTLEMAEREINNFII